MARCNVYLHYATCNLSNLMCILNFIHFFQDECCLRFDIRKDRTIHIFTHYVKNDMSQMRAAFKDFATRNYKWIETVGFDVLGRLQMNSGFCQRYCEWCYFFQ